MNLAAVAMAAHDAADEARRQAKLPKPKEPVDCLPVAVIGEFKAAFAIFDKEGTGEIPTDLLGDLMVTLGQTLLPSEIEEMVRACDEDGSGTIDLTEFLVLMVGMLHDSAAEHEITETFRVFELEGYPNYVTLDVLASFVEGQDATRARREKAKGSEGFLLQSLSREQVVAHVEAAVTPVELKTGQKVVDYVTFVRTMMLA
jgi:Ca2+-binding EF-hand superfamily protein